MTAIATSRRMAMSRRTLDPTASWPSHLDQPQARGRRMSSFVGRGLGVFLGLGLLVSGGARAEDVPPLSLSSLTAEQTAWCESACKEPERPASSTTTVQKLVGGRLVTVEVPTAASRKYETDMEGWRFFAADREQCVARCGCAVAMSKSPLKRVTLESLMQAVCKSHEGHESWASCASAGDGRRPGVMTPWDECAFVEGFDCSQTVSCKERGWCAWYPGGCYPSSFTQAYSLIKPGRFQMGAPVSESRFADEESHTVRLTRSYWLKRTEVTQGEWRELMGTSPSSFKDCGDQCPVESVSWWDAVAYVNALSRKEGLSECYGLSGCSGTPGDGSYACSSASFVGLSCEGYRLPTEAEWEYAARAGTTGATYGERSDVGWFDKNSGESTHRVGQKRANAWGLWDMLGNVAEWVQDWHADYPSTATNPTGPQSGEYRVNRGGCWDSLAWEVRAAYRYGDAPAVRRDYLGFRPARSIP